MILACLNDHFFYWCNFSVLLEFFERKQRKPNPASRDEDLQEILAIRDEYIEKNGISKEKCEDELFE